MKIMLKLDLPEMGCSCGVIEEKQKIFCLFGNTHDSLVIFE
jgi:hypothetical protein